MTQTHKHTQCDNVCTINSSIKPVVTRWGIWANQYLQQNELNNLGGLRATNKAIQSRTGTAADDK